METVIPAADGQPPDVNGQPHEPDLSRADWDYPTVPTLRRAILAGGECGVPAIAELPVVRPPIVGRLVRGFRDLCETMVPAVIIALLINLFLAQATRVFGQSMEPSLHTDQRLVVEKLSYNPWLRLRDPQRGDVVVVHVQGNSELLIKRVIGLPGDRVSISGGQLYINGVPVVESYIARPSMGDFGPVDVPPLSLFVLGDNRNYSNDSRVFGPVPMDNVVGRAWLSYWPPEWWGTVQ